MLLWETILNTRRRGRPVRIPGITRCAAITKSGRRCRGRALPDSPYCVFHDPEVGLASRRRAVPRKARGEARTRYHLPGVASRLTTRRGITEALDKLYNDTREGSISPATGQVLFNILERLLAAYEKSRRKRNPHGPDRSRAAVLCRKLARKYITTVQKGKDGRAGRDGSAGGSPASSEKRPRVTEAEPAPLKLPLFEPDAPRTIPFPASLAAGQA